MKFKELSIYERRERVQQVLRELVADSGYTHRSLAIELGVPKTHVTHVLIGERRVEYVEIFDWLEALGVSHGDFMEML